jgi:60 kDa SS-A/Ro ribonucleoprotein
MAFSIFRHLKQNQTPQSEPIPGREAAMVRNSNAGFSFAVDDWTRLERFLILGSEGGSYYATERALTLENAAVVERCLAADSARTVAVIVAVSDPGRAPRNDPAILALAIAAGSGHVTAAMAALPKVCRTGTHLFQFAEAVDGLRGWGRGLRKGFAAWYERLDANALAYQVAKYAQREGWSHRDLLRLAHPVTSDPARQAVYRWVVGGAGALAERDVKRGEAVMSYSDVTAQLPRLLVVVDEARSVDRKAIVRLIRDDRLPRECVPTEHLNDPDVWEALLAEMPLTAMVRNLAKMTSVGLLKPLSAATRLVSQRLGDAAYLRKARVHPLAVLLAGSTYSRGRGLKGKLTWTPVPAIVDALDGAFELAFANVDPTGQRIFLALDVSGSMAGSYLAGTSISAREASAAMALVTARTEPHYHIAGFTASSSGFGGQWGGGDPTLTPIPIGKRARIADAVAAATALPMGGTDCSLPMRHALREKIEVDTFVVYTDSETWAGPIHPVQALDQYRQKTGNAAKLIVVGMVSNGFSIADPNDAGMLDVVGFDATAPAVMADFARG